MPSVELSYIEGLMKDALASDEQLAHREQHLVSSMRNAEAELMDVRQKRLRHTGFIDACKKIGTDIAQQPVPEIKIPDDAIPVEFEVMPDDLPAAPKPARRVPAKRQPK